MTTSSQREPALITGASRGIGAVYADLLRFCLLVTSPPL